MRILHILTQLTKNNLTNSATSLWIFFILIFWILVDKYEYETFIDKLVCKIMSLNNIDKFDETFFLLFFDIRSISEKSTFRAHLISLLYKKLNCSNCLGIYYHNKWEIVYRINVGWPCSCVFLGFPQIKVVPAMKPNQLNKMIQFCNMYLQTYLITVQYLLLY